jgi:hypothetical protein
VTLAEKVSDQLDIWIEEKPRFCGRIGWIKHSTGEVYIRYNAHFKRIDLSNFAIGENCQRQGIARQIIEMATKKEVRTVRIENILNPEWAEKVKSYQFDNRKTELRDHGFGLVTVDFVREDIPEMSPRAL